MAGNPAELNAEVDARLDRRSGFILRFGNQRLLRNANGDKADVVGISRNGDAAAIIEGHVELTRQAIKVTMVENVMVHALRESADIDEFAGVESAIWRRRDIANVVDARSPGGKSEFL